MSEVPPLGAVSYERGTPVGGLTGGELAILEHGEFLVSLVAILEYQVNPPTLSPP